MQTFKAKRERESSNSVCERERGRENTRERKRESFKAFEPLVSTFQKAFSREVGST